MQPTSPDAEPYEYDRLDLSTPAIRVFTFDRSHNNDPTIRLRLYQIPEPSGQTAVSYVWGTDVPSKLILVNRQRFLVRDNLYALLQHLRVTPEFSGPFWCDAICINQSFILERNHQVQQMGRIYRDANRVFCWLGHGDRGVSSFLRAGLRFLLDSDPKPLVISVSPLIMVHQRYPMELPMSAWGFWLHTGASKFTALS
jgi:hypothetical protein